MIKTFIVSMMLVFLTACAGFPGKPDALTNRVSCTVAKDKAFFNSMYGWIGLTSEVDSKDVDVICNPAAKAK